MMMADGAAEYVTNYRHATSTTKGPDERKRSNQLYEATPVQEVKRQHRAKVMSPEAPQSTLYNLREMAMAWMKAELRFYQDLTNYSPWRPTSNEKGPRQQPPFPPVSHLEAAANEFATRFPFRSVEEDEEQIMNDDNRTSESPFLLVATGVCDNWEVPEEFQNVHSVRFMLVQGETKDVSLLFIYCMTGPEHGVFHAFITTDIDDWIKDNELRTFLRRLDAGGKGYEPDKSYRPGTPDRQSPDLDADARLNGAPYARLVMEVEYAHRSAYALREVGYLALQNPYTRLFLAVKIWKKGQAGKFGAAAVLWGKDDDGVKCVKQAIDFGTEKLEHKSKVKFQEKGNAKMLPPVTEWTRPEPSQGHDDLHSELESYSNYTLEEVQDLPVNDSWCIKLAKADLLYKTSTRRSTDNMPYLLDENATFPDCTVNLQAFVWQINQEKF